MMHRDGWTGRKNTNPTAFAWFVFDRNHNGSDGTVHRLSLPQSDRRRGRADIAPEVLRDVLLPLGGAKRRSSAPTSDHQSDAARKILLVSPTGVAKTSLLRTLNSSATLFVNLSVQDVPVDTIRINDWSAARDLASRGR
jgi:hypothetical protein